MYEGIKDIYTLLDAGRLKEALTQLKAIATQTNRWNLQARIDECSTAYGYMLQYAAQGVEDPTRKHFYRKTLRTAYELTDATDLALLSAKGSGAYYERIRTLALRPAKTYAELQMQLETFTEDASTAPLMYTGEKRLQAEREKIYQAHEEAVAALFDKTWATPFWTDSEASEANALLQSVLVSAHDQAVMTSAVTLSLLRLFDPRKLGFLLDAYSHASLLVNQRAILGIAIAAIRHERRIALYPDLVSRLSLLSEDQDFRNNLHTIQMQLLLTRETTKIDRKMREEIMPEVMKNARQLNDPKFRFDEAEDPEDRNPEWQERMENSTIGQHIREMSEWQTAGADIYMSSFSQLKHYPFFHQPAHWFYPFSIELPLLAPLRKELDEATLSPLKLIVSSTHFCNSDKYSFAFALLNMPAPLRTQMMAQMDAQAADEESRSRLQQAYTTKPDAKAISRQYIQDLYRFFKLWRNRSEEEDIFQWPFDLWQNNLFGDALQGEDITRELADHLLQRDYPDEALTLYRKLIGQGSTQAEVYQKAGYILQKQKHYDEAISHYRRADILLPDNLWTNKHLAQCHRLAGNLTEALEHYRKVEAVQPDNLNIALQIGQCLARMERYADALTYFYKVEYLEKNPDNARRAIAWCSLLSGKHDEALKYYTMLLAQPSPKAHDWMNAGHVYFVMHRVPQAVEHYRQAQSHEESHTAFVEKFNKDRPALLSLGLTDEDLMIMQELVVC